MIVPPAGSAAAKDRTRPALLARLDDADPGTARWTRLALVVGALVPLFVLWVRGVKTFAADSVLGWYGLAVLASLITVFLLAYGFYRDPSDPRHLVGRDRRGDPPPLPPAPKVSFLVAVMNEVEIIEQCVRSMIASDYPHLEVIVVDDCSTDGTRQRLEQLAETLPFRLVALQRNVGKKHALVNGARLATGDVLAFTDSDCVLAADALRRCVAALLLDPRLGAVSGHARALNADESLLTKAQDTWYEGSFRVSKAAEAVFGSVACVSGPLAVFRRDAIWNYLPAWANDRFLGAEFRFATDRQLTGYVLGQRWHGRRLKHANASSPFVAEVDHPERRWRVGYVRAAKVWTAVPATRRAFLKQQVRWKKSFFRNLCFTGRFMWRRGPGAALLYYGHALWVLAAPAMVVRHLLIAPLRGMWLLTALYLLGVVLKGTVWGLAYLFDHPGSTRWRHRSLMSLISAVGLSWLLPYSLATIRKGIWSRGTK